MKMSEELSALMEKVDSIKGDLTEMDNRLKRAQDAWPDHQFIAGAVWYDRDKTPPDGHVWATDGTRVWLINAGGEPIGKAATAVKFWTDAYIPAPPSFIAG